MLVTVNDGQIQLHAAETKKTTERWGRIASFVLAITCLVAAIHQMQIILPLISEGRRADALVVGFDVEVKGNKKAVYQFVTETGATVTSRDVFDMYLIRLHKEERVVVLYDPSDPSIATADLGLWKWQGPGIFFFGFVILTALGLMLPRLDARGNKR